MPEEKTKAKIKKSRYGPYTEEVIKHFRNPKNMGEIEDADALAKVGSPICGDELWVYLKIDKKAVKALPAVPVKRKAG